MNFVSEVSLAINSYKRPIVSSISTQRNIYLILNILYVAKQPSNTSTYRIFTNLNGILDDTEARLML